MTMVIARGHMVVGLLLGRENTVMAARAPKSRFMADWLDLAGRIEGFRFVPADVAVAAKSTTLPSGFHPDPADRLSWR